MKRKAFLSLIAWRGRHGRGKPSMLSWRWVLWAILISLTITTLAIISINLLTKPNAISVIEGETEYLQYRSFNPQLSAFSINGFSVSYLDNTNLEGICLEGTLMPNVDSRISYIKRRGDRMMVEIDGSGRVQGSDSLIQFSESLGLHETPSCGDTNISKLPVWGPGQIGDAFSVRAEGIGPVLIKGTLSVFGRTLDLGLLGTGGAIYAATSQPITLPPGGWIWTDGASLVSKEFSPEESALFGFLEPTDDAFDMSLTTETPLLQIIAPGGRLTPNRVEIGMFAQILNDPNILRLQLFIFIFFFLLPVVTDLLGLLLSYPGRKNDVD